MIFSTQDGAIRSPVRRAHAETYLLISLAAFAGSVMVTRLFLELTGFPQLGNDVLHVAHALWGGLLLLVGVLLPLILANGWALRLGALLSGLGVGLFIDEVGKFITRTNDYFYPPAAPLIYAVFLLMVLLFLFVRRKGDPNPRAEMYRALEGLAELIDNNLDERELELLLLRLKDAQTAELPHVAGLAKALNSYLSQTEIPLLPARPSLWHRFEASVDNLALRIGRAPMRMLILMALLVLIAGSMLTALSLVIGILVHDELAQIWQTAVFSRVDVQSGFWLIARVLLETLVGLISLAGVILILRGQELRGVHAAKLALLLSLTGVILMSFYLDQFSAIFKALLQFGTILLLMVYERRYLFDPQEVRGHYPKPMDYDAKP
ncbi:MAG: hypothetical protein U9R25_04470 [Chloroflexota bacterium]|nr:hypothetical protein [Chloroflexota bacterium]